MRQKITFCLIFFEAIFIHAQKNIKKFTSNNGRETITYSYYQEPNTLENVKHGEFYYKSLSTDGKSVSLIQGKYLNGLKDGVWSWDVKLFNSPSALQSSLFTYKITKTFSKGIRNGVWHSNKTVKTYKSNNLINSFSWDLMQNYSNNILTGKLIYKENQNLPITLNFNNKGRLVGDYLLNYAGKIRLNSNSDGIITSYDDGRNLNINNESVIAAKKFIDGEITQEQAEKQNISINRISLDGYFYDAHVFDENAVKMPADGEIADNVVNGHYILSYFSPTLVELNNQIKKNEEEKSAELELQKILKPFQNTKFKVTDFYNKKNNQIIVSKYDPSKCSNLLVDFRYGKVYLIKQKTFKREFSSSCLENILSTYEIQINPSNKNLNFGGEDYVVTKINENSYILESQSEKFTIQK